MSDPDERVVARATALIEMGRYGPALELIAPLLAARPADPDLLLLAAQGRLGLGDPASARVHARSALRHEPDSELGLLVLSLAAAEDHDWDEARLAADRAREIHPQLWQAHRQRADVDVAQGAITASTWTAAHAAVQLAPEQPGPHLTLGLVALRDGNPAAASAAFAQSLRLDPDNADARNNLAVAELRRRRWDRAARHLTAALRTDPRSDIAARNLRLVVRAWVGVVQVVAVIGSWVLVVALAGEQGVTQGRTVPLTLPDGQVTTTTLPSTDYTVLPTGHPGVVTGVAAVVVAVGVLAALLLRRAVGRRFGALLRISDVPTRIAAALCGAVALALVLCAVVGMPAARPLAITTVVVDLVALMGLAWYRRRTA